MNERIRELLEQAGVFYAEMPKDTVYEKFAESIIKECADLCTHEGPFTSEVIWGKQFRQQILKHFGVE